MSHIAHNPKTLQILRQSQGPDWQLVHHFFDFRAGDSIGNNFEGFLRSFLLQLSQKNPDLLSRAPEFRAFAVKDSINSRPSINAMYNALKQTFANSSIRLLVLLDGLDEYGGQKVELVNLINNLGSEHVKFCLASRADPPFPDAFHCVPSFEMQRLNISGIKAFAVQTLQNFFSHSEHYDHASLQRVANDIAHRSRGVFLWARFATFELIDGLTRGETLDSAALRRRLEQVPQELQDIYSRIFRRGTQGDRETAGLVLLLISTAQSELVLEELREAVDLLPRDLVPFQNSILSSSDKTSLTDHAFHRIVFAANGGTIETYIDGIIFTADGGTIETCIVDGFGRRRPRSLIRLSHRTVKSYLDLRGWQELLGDNFSPGLGHMLWLQICAKTLLLGSSNLKWSSPRDYTLRHLPDHAMLFEEISQKSSFPLMSSLLSTEFVDAHVCNDREYPLCCRGLPMRLVHEPIDLAIAHGWLRYVEDYLSVKGRDIRREAPNMRRLAILCALRARAIRAVQSDPILAVVLKHHPLVEDNDVVAALLEGSSATLRILLQYCGPGKLCLNPSEPPEEYLNHNFWGEGEQYGPLYIIGERGSSDAETEAIIDLLLERGEDINDLCGPQGTVSHSHIQGYGYPFGYNYKFIELLIDRGLDINRSGPHGNALEYLWQVANKPLNNPAYAMTYREEKLQLAICHLIDLGSVNRRQDPNGLIPSVDEMRNFSVWKGKTVSSNSRLGSRKYKEWNAWVKERTRHYLEGPLDSAPH